MFLKSIELYGFKSFADRSRIEFREGVSALLGPNGCGKSNIVDAVKWVLGEQSTKTLRAEKMEDIIFNGTDNRKALNLAEVTLVLSNDQGILPLDMPEIAIKRRLYRSGESEYFVNGQGVLLRELKEIFFDTGVGKSAYSIMEQGKIDQVLSNKPEERRFIFEEAAGITRYKSKSAEAERKLERTEENIRQVEGILGEVKRSYDSLKKQAEKAEVFRKLESEIFEIDTDLQLLKLRDFLEKQNAKEKLLAKAESLRAGIKGKIDGINESLSSGLHVVNEMEGKLVGAQKKLYGIDLEKNSRQSKAAMLKERKGELERQARSCDERQGEIEKRIALLDEQITEKKRVYESFAAELQAVEKNIAEFRRSIDGAAGMIRENDREMKHLASEVQRLVEEQEALEGELHSLTDDIVTQLDEGFSTSGYNTRRRTDLEQQVRDIVSSMNIGLQGKRSFWKDAEKLKTLGNDAPSVEKFIQFLEILQEDIRRLEEVLEAYRKEFPRFIDDFVAPEGIITRKRSLDREIGSRKIKAQECRNRTTELVAENRSLQAKIEEYRGTLEDLRVNQVQMKTQQEGIREAVDLLQKDRHQQENRRKDNEQEKLYCLSRMKDLDLQITQVVKEKEELEKEELLLKNELAQLEKGISEKNKNLLGREKDLQEQLKKSEKIQEEVEKLQIELTTLQADTRNIYDNFRERYSRELSEYDDRIHELKKDPQDLRNHLGQLKNRRRDLGHVNLMALEEFHEVKERYDFLNSQLSDLIKAREDLRQITSHIRNESTRLFIETYEKIRKNFHLMFRRLFGGGRAELKLTDHQNILTSGIDIYAQPPGKKQEHIALLSGGERSLTAVALLFATYMVKPSPFCILDEIDAALDEENVGRFINILTDFEKRSQFVIITHNKRTVTGASTLLGVTMEESGVSKVVTVSLDRGEKVGAAT